MVFPDWAFESWQGMVCLAMPLQTGMKLLLDAAPLLLLAADTGRKADREIIMPVVIEYISFLTSIDLVYTLRQS